MSLLRAERIASTLLYEGYMLYPYRPSAVKNRQRFNFGVLFPEEFVDSRPGSDSSAMQTECLIEGEEAVTVDVKVRFLHLLGRAVGRLESPAGELPFAGDGGGAIEWVERLRVGDRLHLSWQEAVEHEVGEWGVSLGELCAEPRTRAFTYPAVRAWEPIRGSAGTVVGVIERRQRAISGELELRARRLRSGLFAVCARVVNRTSLHGDLPPTRDDALLRSLVSAHTILASPTGAFVSALDPPPALSEAALSCRNIGTWPVLAGEEGSRDTILSSPIIIYDHPEIAAESPGDLFDSTEIDEILSLRILTLTDDEKREMSSSDERARALLARTESLGAADMMNLHGVMRPNAARGR